MRLSPSVALLRTQSDDRLVALARDGWEPAFTALVERYRRLVLRACCRILPENRAEDATQQVFVAAWTALRRGDEVREVRPWLLRIARNSALNALRVPGYDYDELADSLRVSEAPQAELERREVVRATLTGLAGLPERQRDALLRSAVQGASHADIARELGIGEGAARQLVLRARSTLRGAATALTPAPLIHWALTRAADATVAEAIAGSSAAGAGATGILAKAGVVAALAGGAMATPVVIKHRHASVPAAAEAAVRPAAKAAHAGEANATPVADPVPAATAAATAASRRVTREHVSAPRHRTVAPAATPTPHRAARQEDRHDDGGTTRERERHHSQDSGDRGSEKPSGDSGEHQSSHQDAPEAEPTETPEATRTPEPTETPEPTQTPEATGTPSPDDRSGDTTQRSGTSADTSSIFN